MHTHHAPDSLAQESSRLVFSGKTILIADHDANARTWMYFILAGKGARVLEAKDGWELLWTLSEHPTIAVVIADLQLPGVPGTDLVSMIRSATHGTPCLLVGSFDDLLDYDQHAGVADDVIALARPFAATALVTQLIRAIDAACAPSVAERLDRRMHAIE